MTEDKFTKYMESEFESKAEESYITVSDGSQLRCLRTYAHKEASTNKVLFILPGWGSVVLGWEDVLFDAMEDFDIVYLESREKYSSKLVKGTKNNLERFSQDVKECLDHLQLDEENLILMCSSFGGVVLADGLGKNKFTASNIIFVAPAIKIDLVPVMRYFIPIVPHWTMNLVKPIIKLWLKKSKSESPEQAAKYIRVMNEADSRKWKNISPHFLFWEWWEVYEKVEHEVFLIGAEKDKMHAADLTKRIGQLMKNSKYYDLGTNKNTHSKPLIDFVREHVVKKIK